MYFNVNSNHHYVFIFPLVSGTVLNILTYIFALDPTFEVRFLAFFFFFLNPTKIPEVQKG